MARQKTPAEIAQIEEVQRAAEAAMAGVIEYLRTSENPTSEEAHAAIDRILAEHGCESPKGHMVASGAQAVEPHDHGSGPVKKNVPIVIDIFPRSKKTGYFADMSRTVCIGIPTPEAQKMYDAVLHAQELAISMIRPGLLCKEIQEAVENYFVDAGYATSGKGKEFGFAEGFVHSIGHGVGQEIHERPHFGKKSEDSFMAGDVIAVEPGLYYPQIGGIRIEDLVLVTEDGCRNLTKYTKKFVL